MRHPVLGRAELIGWPLHTKTEAETFPDLGILREKSYSGFGPSLAFSKTSPVCASTPTSATAPVPLMSKE